MNNIEVILQPRKDSVGVDIICADCNAVLLENLPSVQAAYYRAGEFVEHECDVKVLAA